MDFLAIASLGAYPDPGSSPSAAQRMALAATYGLLNTLAAVSGWLHTINTVSAGNIASVNTVLRANISTINTT